MDKKTEQRIQRFEKRMGCSLGECGAHITIIASKDYLDNVESDKQVYSSRCAKCGSTFQLKKTELEFFERHFGKAEFQILSTTFNTLFDE